MGQKLDLAVGLARVGFKAQRQLTRGPQRGRMSPHIRGLRGQAGLLAPVLTRRGCGAPAQ